MAQTVTLASSTGTAQIALNPVAKSTTVLFSVGTSGSTGAVTLEMTLDDLSAPGVTATWATLSSGAAMLSSNITSGLVYTVLSPIGGVRINSTANNTANTFTLKALQSVTA